MLRNGTALLPVRPSVGRILLDLGRGTQYLANGVLPPVLSVLWRCWIGSPSQRKLQTQKRGSENPSHLPQTGKPRQAIGQSETLGTVIQQTCPLAESKSKRKKV